MSKAVYCKCKNTYSIKCKHEQDCKTPYYWSQGIGRINALPTINEVFEQTFDNTFK